MLFASLLIPPALLGAVLVLGRYEESVLGAGGQADPPAPGRRLRVVPDLVPADGRIVPAPSDERPAPPRAG
ncbi:hypothetical protein [Streptomyces sp. NPDC059176]|uniref:hypothetical protein n=1 Tax=Streptomyces sp. NPDC059176 TaxID=3346758 RepID=UPI0036875D5A